MSASFLDRVGEDEEVEVQRGADRLCAKMDQLDDAITTARASEGTLIAAEKAKDANADPANEETLKELAPDEYTAYRAAFDTVEDLFRQVIGRAVRQRANSTREQGEKLRAQ